MKESQEENKVFFYFILLIPQRNLNFIKSIQTMTFRLNIKAHSINFYTEFNPLMQNWCSQLMFAYCELSNIC